MAEEIDVFKTRPDRDIVAIERPAIHMEMPPAMNCSMLQIHHPHHGWLSFLFPPDLAQEIGAMFLKHAEICAHAAKIAPPSTPKVQ